MAFYDKSYDVIVVGAGHAGCEAALAAARMGCSVLLLTIDLDKIAAMPCSPSIGGMAKGQLVKEIDALGGQMAKVTDRSAIQYRTLNTRKGPAVRATRTQNDKVRYHLAMKAVLEQQDNIDLKQGHVERLITENNTVTGVEDATGFCFGSKTVILTTGTFLDGVIHIGHRSIQAGRAGECGSYGLPRCLAELGLSLGTMKTGTPPRLRRSSIDFDAFTRQESDESTPPFSFSAHGRALPQQPCYIGHTCQASHDLVRANLERSALYGGIITGTPARYCPSFEDKIVRFPDRDRHQIILEPEGLETGEIYASGLGNSLPIEIQIEFVRSVKGLEQAEIMRPAYAIEYSFANPLQLRRTLESNKISGLFLAGQINGTSGYEEAAAQGLWAGVNAACSVQGRPPFVLGREQAYMGVMIDDLVTRGTREPYRMFTSRAEYRLMLREDNADLRLSGIARELGLIDSETFSRVQEIQRQIATEKKRLTDSTLGPSPEVNALLEQNGQAPLSTGTTLEQLLKRDGITWELLEQISPPPEPVHARAAQQAETDIKYDGYIQRQLREIEKMGAMEKSAIPADFDFTTVHGLSNELKQRLSEIRPESIGQMSRIEGITPAAVSAVVITLKRLKSRPEPAPAP
jgi:tRNA uridine 5-carboxymethylaminomethyl modification enzyme